MENVEIKRSGSNRETTSRGATEHRKVVCLPSRNMDIDCF
jgi:hypothetical protein